MNLRPLCILLGLLASAGTLHAQEGRRCVVRLLNAEHEGARLNPFPGSENWFLGGNVKLRCEGQEIYLGGDSLQWFAGQMMYLYHRADQTIRASYEDSDYKIVSDTIAYFKTEERIHLTGHVVITDKLNGSTLSGPLVDYSRKVRGIRDSAIVVATGRPTVRYVPRPTPGRTAPPSPLLLSADYLRGFGSSHLIGSGKVTVDRDSLEGRSDSLDVVNGMETVANLIGGPARIRRVAKDSFQVIGKVVKLFLTNDKLREVRSAGEGHTISNGSDILADSIVLKFTDEKLAGARAWDRAKGARVLRDGYDIRGDTVEVDTPGEKLKELRVFGRGVLKNPIDSLKPGATDSAGVRDRDTLWGDRIVAQFDQVDSAGTPKTRIRRLEAKGGARTLFSQMVTKRGITSPSINYTRSQAVEILMKRGDSTGVAEIHYRGKMDGVMLESASLRRNDSLPPAPFGGRP